MHVCVYVSVRPYVCLCAQAPVCVWFLEITFVGKSVYMSPRLLIVTQMKQNLNSQLNKLWCFLVSIYSTCHQCFFRAWP